ncbi:nitroreductase [Mycolicibacterium sp. CH28]|uniref:nitroreductase n=1 Tax=Mycolicibacterium sp. CH28 TaxID=2512237 RepID=UPI00108054A3|nr:nitroreductase [Mycolicibacterium sp. CH28]TGD87913.1 nitroreductase [Mycolicibacterium sp. CH28]
MTTDPSATTETAALARLLQMRWSCRSFQPQPVDRAVINSVLDLARRTPSWCNTQPWQVLITEGEATERLRAGLTSRFVAGEVSPDFDFPNSYTGAYQDRRRECAVALYDSVGIERGDRAASAAQTAKNFELFGAPHVAILTTEADLGVYGAVDCGLYCQTFLLAAQSLGLGAIPQAALATQASFLREFFGLPEHRLVVCGISFGWPDLTAPVNGFRTTRLPVEDTATFVVD